MTPRNAVATLNKAWGKERHHRGHWKDYRREEDQPLEPHLARSYIWTSCYVRWYIPYGSNDWARRFRYLQPLLAPAYYILRQALENKAQETGSIYRTISGNYYSPLGFMALIPKSHGCQNVHFFSRCSIFKNLLSELILVRLIFILTTLKNETNRKS